ncbi:hypothetical protein ACFL3V_06100 [Nanoarchaeota archaeon]
MIEFNPDGSIKLPGKLAKHKADQDSKMQHARCMKVRKEIVSTYAPKSCALHITLSDKITDNRFVENIHQEWTRAAEVPSKLNKMSEKEFKVEIGTCFSRCKDCTSLIQRYRSFLYSNIIEQNGSCEYKSKMASRFCKEDYFD